MGIKNMISGASQADVALIMVPADGNFTTAIQRGNHKQGIVQGQTRQHARLINLLGGKQISLPNLFPLCLSLVGWVITSSSNPLKWLGGLVATSSSLWTSLNFTLILCWTA